MKPVLTALAMLLAAAPASAQTLEVGRIKWSALPPLKIKDRWFPTGDLVVMVENILKAKECSLAGQSPGDFDVIVPYAMSVEPDGKINRILVSDIGCRPIEALVGKILLERAKLGDVKPTGEKEAIWFGDRINFTLQ